MTLILGTSTSIFLSTGREPSIEFPLTNENGGLRERWEWKKNEHELLSYKLSQQHHGYRLVFDFHFDDWADGETLIKFKKLKNSMDLGNEWNLRPRNEEQYLGRIFKVLCTSDNFDVVLDSGGVWHTGFHIQFSTTEIVPSIDWTLVIPPTTPIEYAFVLEDGAGY